MKESVNFLDILTNEQILRTVPSGLFLVNTEQRITYWNPEAERITGFSSSDVLGKHCSFLEGIPCGRSCGIFDGNLPKPLTGQICTISTKMGQRIILSKNVDYLRDDRGMIIGGIESFIDITERIEIEKNLDLRARNLEQAIKERTSALEEEHLWLHNLLDSMTDFAYICSPDFRIEFMNRAMRETYGNLVGEICYQSLYGLDTTCPRCPLQSVLKGQTVKEERFHGDSNRTFEIIHSPLKTSEGDVRKLAVFRDFTERREAENQVIAAKARLEHLLHSSPAVIYTSELSGEFGCTFIGRNVEDQLGYPAKDFLASPEFWVSRIHPDDKQAVLNSLQDAMSRGYGAHEYRCRHKNGSFRWMRNEFRLIRDSQGKPAEILGFWIDITEGKEVEEKLREANRQLGAFVSMVSHDLRSPLTPIIGYAEFLKRNYRDRLDDRALHALEDIESQGRKMLSTMEDLLVLARVGRLEPLSEPVNTGAVLTNVLGELNYEIIRDRIQFRIENLPPLYIPSTFLFQIFSNLVGNAIRYAGGPGASIDIIGKQVGDRAILSVRDFGPGIIPEERDRIFETFYRGQAGRKIPGSGVGLATVRKIVQLYGGRVWVEETPGGGSTFLVELPMGRPGGNPDQNA